MSMEARHTVLPFKRLGSGIHQNIPETIFGLGPFVLMWFQAQFPCSYMPRQIKLRKKMNPISFFYACLIPVIIIWCIFVHMKLIGFQNIDYKDSFFRVKLDTDQPITSIIDLYCKSAGVKTPVDL